MIYRQDKRNKKKFTNLILLAVFLLIILTPLKVFFSNFSINLFSKAGILRAQAQELFEDTELTFLSKSQLIEKIKVQEEEIKRLTIVESLYNDLLADFQKANDLLGIKDEFPELIFAEVLSNPSQNIYSSILINKNFPTNSLVFSQTGVPIGTIESSTNKNSTVLFFSHSGREVEAHLGSDTTPVTLVGKSSGNFTISLPREIKVEQGQKVYLPGIKTAIATVGFVEFDARDPFQTVFLLSDQNIYKLDYVLVQNEI